MRDPRELLSMWRYRIWPLKYRISRPPVSRASAGGYRRMRRGGPTPLLRHIACADEEQIAKA